VLAADKRMVNISTAGDGASQLIRAPVGVLRLYSGMIDDMVTDGVLGSVDNADMPVANVPANQRHHRDAVSASLRWAMGLHTMLAADVHHCAQVLWCAAACKATVMCCRMPAFHEPAFRCCVLPFVHGDGAAACCAVVTDDVHMCNWIVRLRAWPALQRYLTCWY
jgi:hypothetical protein